MIFQVTARPTAVNMAESAHRFSNLVKKLGGETTAETEQVKAKYVD